MKLILTNVLISVLTFIIIAIIFISGNYVGELRMKEFVLVRCMAQSSKWYPYPELCKYYVGDINGRGE